MSTMFEGHKNRLVSNQGNVLIDLSLGRGQQLLHIRSRQVKGADALFEPGARIEACLGQVAKRKGFKRESFSG